MSTFGCRFAQATSAEAASTRPASFRDAYGQPSVRSLILDGEALSGSQEIEARSLVWSKDGDRLVAQALVDWADCPTTQVVVFDTERRRRIAASRPRRGIANPIGFEPGGVLLYRHWNQRTGDQERRLKLDSE
jgi:hypothetical protein